MAAQCGWFTLLWDITLGEDYDLTRFENQRKIFGWMQSGFFELVILGHLATRCHGQGTNQVALLLCEVTSIL